MQTARIAIIGAGLSGLYAAYLLERRGIRDYVILEARDTLGGRITTAHASGMTPLEDDFDRFDLGATWFWPDYQRTLDRVVSEFGLERFEQDETGDMVVERSPDDPPVHVRGYVDSPTPMRLAGGMASLIDALSQRLDATRIIAGQQVRRLQCDGRQIELEAHDRYGDVMSYRVDRVFLAVPPRLAMATIDFRPALPEVSMRAWQSIATWMAPHAKYVAVYDKPFWRALGLSGKARSASGPLAEIHDASVAGGSAALFGFLSLPAHVRWNLSEDVLCSHCRAQLYRLFGPWAAAPKAEFIKDWAADPYTATVADQDGPAYRSIAPLATASAGIWRNRVIGIASEWSSEFPGYLAGAIKAASDGVEAFLLESTANRYISA